MKRMNGISRLNLLADQMHFEHDGEFGCSKVSKRKWDDIAISSAILPSGKPIKLLKTLLTSACERDCYYCPFRAGRNFRRATFRPNEFAQLTSNLYRNGIIEGVFLSSGIVAGGIETQDKLIKTAEIMRHKLDYHGYLHLKIMPGAQYAQVERVMHLADRVSVNLEAPNSRRLEFLAPNKKFIEELVSPLKWANEIRQTKSPHLTWKGRWPSSVTQYVVGGAGESDLELLQTTEHLYDNYGLTRAYFSPFNPVDDTPLENESPTPSLREHRLYQASYLLRDYGFAMEELAFNEDENLPLNIDPKLAWAKINLKINPIELNRADKQELMKIPGIGPRCAQAIIKSRRHRNLHYHSELRKLGVNVNKAAPFIRLNGKRPTFQLEL